MSLALALISLLPASPQEPADRIVLGRLFTLDAQQPWAEGLAIRGNRIVAVGSRARIEQLQGPDTQVLDAEGHTVLPGFNDAHCHFTVAYGLDMGCDLSRATSLAEIQGELRAYAAAHPEYEVLSGWGWDLADLPDGVLPDATMLDAVGELRPIVTSSEGPHSLWVSTAALERMRLPEVDPPGRITHRQADGSPSGYFVGRGLMGLAPEGPLPEPEAIERRLRSGLEQALRCGVTSVHDSVPPFVLPVLCALQETNELTLRLHVWGWLQGPGSGPEATRALAQRYARGDWITFGTLKGGLDGMPGLRTSALLAPYADDPESRGLMTEDPGRLQRAVAAANAAGFRVALHATGDAAVRLALDAFESAHAAHPELENRIEHAFYVAPEDRARFAANGVIASLQPGFLARDWDRRRFHEARLGPERLAEAFPVRSLLAAGATVAFGTDCCLTPLDPFYGIRAAVTRQSPTGEPAGGWLPEERVSLEEALRAYTLGSARAEGAQERKGSLSPGKLADVIVLSGDLFSLRPEQLGEVRVEATIVDGVLRWQRGG